jgi:hypothetical protein
MTGGYLGEVLRLLREVPPRRAGAVHVRVLHDRWCGIWRGGRCERAAGEEVEASAARSVKKLPLQTLMLRFGWGDYFCHQEERTKKRLPGNL